MKTLQDNSFVINIASINGSGTQTANSVLLRSLFRMGIPVGGKNIFPSNISGMPTWFWIRANAKGYTGAVNKADIVVALNPQTFESDQNSLTRGGYFFYPEGKNLGKTIRSDVNAIALPIQSLAENIKSTIKIKKLASNMIYVGVLSELLSIPKDIIENVLRDQLEKKATALQANLEALELGQNYARENLSSLAWTIKSKVVEETKSRNKILMDGNTAAGLGLVAGGCQFVSWYPITPSTSVVESFERFALATRKDLDGKNKFAVLQAEDELAAFSMVLGAGWAGTRAMTATSGPGLSLMAEGAGFAYYAEIPTVIWNVQRLGPSTGLPTRTAQGDILFSAFLSHGDAKHILLFPGTIQECFEFGQTCFDLAERLQQLVIVLSDLDLGMNLWMSDELSLSSKPYDRGKVFNSEDLDKRTQYYRYEDTDGDGICARTLPGNAHAKAAYFTRGSGHNFRALYSEKANEYSDNILRLDQKWQTAKKLVPQPEISTNQNSDGLFFYGSTCGVINELTDLLIDKNIHFDLCRVKAFPFNQDVDDFIKNHNKIYVIEQNRDGQMKTLLAQAYPQWAHKITSILHFDGTPVTADGLLQSLISARGEL